MDALTELETQVRTKLAAVDQMREAQQTALAQEMVEIDRRMELVGRVADDLMQGVIRPRVEIVAKQFENFRPLNADGKRSRHCAFEFPHIDRYPATARLDLSVGPDERLEKVVVNYSLEILPVFFQFCGHDQCSFALDAIDPQEVGRWVDTKLLAFVDDYLKVATLDVYHQDNMVIDPVCKMRINRLSTASVSEHAGTKYHFCSDARRRKFLENPASYVH